MDDDVAKLAREERILEAATLARDRGDPASASTLFERACEWTQAAREAARAGDAVRALLLAALGRDDATAHAAIAVIISDLARDRAPASIARLDHAAHTLEQRGDHAWAARLLDVCGRPIDAARAWERAGEAERAAERLEAAGDVGGAARVLESALRRAPESSSHAIALGSLLLRHGKTEAAVRVLQKVPPADAKRRRALTLLVRALDAMGLTESRSEAARELDTLGGPEASGDADAPPGGAIAPRIFGRYEVLREVASSVTARVLACVDGVRGERVAVKIFAGWDMRGAGRDALTRFEREVKILAALDHPNTVPLRDYVPEGPAIVLAWMGGGTLEERMAASQIAPARAVEIVAAVLSALGEAHRLGVLHRDVKPANVLFDDAGVTRLGDFGVAHLGDLSATATAGVIGTLAYMSPEQREGRPATIASDLYGAGMLLFEMLSGERPKGADAARVRPSAVHRELDARHDDAVMRMLATDPSERPVDASAARRALLALRWPAVLELAAPRRTAPAPDAGTSDREPRATFDEGTRSGFDRWIERAFELTPLDAESLARAAIFAQGATPALQAILRVDRDSGHIWLERAEGTRRLKGAQIDALTDAQIDALRHALDALHALGCVHGRIDRDHVLVREDGDVVLRFTSSVAVDATAEGDRLALARLHA